MLYFNKQRQPKIEEGKNLKFCYIELGGRYLKIVEVNNGSEKREFGFDTVE